MVEAIVNSRSREHLLFSRSLRVGAGSFDDDRQINALHGCKECVWWWWGNWKVFSEPYIVGPSPVGCLEEVAIVLEVEGDATEKK
jgi:hypothetical protein